MSNYKDFFAELDQKSATQNSHGIHTKEPDWLMLIPNGEDKYYTKSAASKEKTKLDGEKSLSNFSYVYDFQLSLNRGIESTSINGIKPTGGLIGHDCKVIVPSSSISADLHLAFFENTLLKSVSIIRIGTLNNKLDILEQYNFVDVYLTGMLTKSDILAISFRYAQIERKESVYNETGASEGKRSAMHSLLNAHSSKE